MRSATVGLTTTIVGGGVYGCGLAWFLARAGVSVTVLERAKIADGASGGAGFRGVRGGGRHVAELALMPRSYWHWERLDDALAGPTGFDQIGSFHLHDAESTGGPGDFRRITAQAELQNRFGVATQVLTGEELRDLLEGLAPVVDGALWCPFDGVVEQAVATRRFALAAQECGATIREDTAVTGVVTRHGRVVALELADGASLPVDGAVVLLANEGNVALTRAMGYRAPIWSRISQVIFVDGHRQPPFRALVNHEGRHISSKWIGDRMMISGGWRGRSAESRVRYAELSPVAQRHVDQAVAVFPGLSDAVYSVDTTRSDTACIDELPIIDLVPGLENVIAGFGWSGHGFAIAPTVTELLARWLLDGRRPALLAPFSMRRLAVPSHT